MTQETRRWDDNKEHSYAMRSKEDAQDYRYFPEPDLVPIVISDEWIEKIRAQQPELRTEKLERYKKNLTSRNMMQRSLQNPSIWQIFLKRRLRSAISRKSIQLADGRDDASDEGTQHGSRRPEVLTGESGEADRA